MNTILTSLPVKRVFFILSLVIVVAALVVQAVIGIVSAQVHAAQYCHFWCSEYGQCLWVCEP